MYRQRHYLIIASIMAILSGAAFSQTAQNAPAPAQPAAPVAVPTVPTAPPAPKSDAVPPTPTPVRGPFETDTTPVDAGPAQPVNPDTLEVSVSFVKADLANVLSFLSLASGVPVVVDGDVKGTVTITSMKKVPLTEAYDVINSALRVRGYTMVGTLKDKVISVVPLKRAIDERPLVKTGSDAATVGVSSTVITQVIPLQYTSAAKLRDDLKPLVPDDQANMIAVSSTNTLIVTDTEANVKRLLQIVNLLDKDTSDVLSIEVYQCRFASASILITSLSQALGLVNGATPTPTSSQTQPQQPQFRMPGRPGASQASPTPSTTADSDNSGLISLEGTMHVAADDRTNSIIISASRPKITMVLDLIKKLDVDTTPVVSARIFPLQYADATMVASQLTSIFQQPQSNTSSSGSGNPFFQRMGLTTTSTTDNSYAGLKSNVVVADVRTNAVVVTATPQNMEEFARVIKELDTPNALDQVARSFPLKYATAATLATALTQLFSGNTQTTTTRPVTGYSPVNSSSYNGDPLTSLKNITVVAETKTNSLLITGPPQAFPMIENLLSQLDRRTSQVYIEVAVVDVDLNDEDKFGIEWNFKSTTPSGNGTTASQGFGLAGQTAGLSYSVISGNLQALLAGLGTKSNVKVYSTPTITTEDNVAAKVTIGEDVPYVTSNEETTAGTVLQSVSFENVSVALNVTPHVNVSSDLIGLDVDQTINEVIGQSQQLNAPIIANREAKTSVMVNDGQTIVIGGILKDSDSKTNQNVPFFSKLPLIGELFKSHDNTKERSELMVFLTPHILRDEQNVTDVTKAAAQQLSEPITSPQKKAK